MSKLKVAFQGRLGAYGESACYHLCGKNIELVPCTFFEDVYEAILNKSVDYGVIPIENTTTGSVYQNFSNLLKYKIPIVGEVKLKIEHSLMVMPGVKIENLTRVMSHEQALGQCTDLFKKHPYITAQATFDTAGSAEMIANNKDMTAGALASSLAAKRYGLEVIQKNVENNNETNYTRHVGLQLEPLDLTNVVETKTSIVYIPKENHPGLLHEALGIFAEKGVDLLKIESRPRLGTPFEYIFHLDFKGDITKEHVRQAIDNLRAVAEEVVILGSYPIGEFKNLIEE